MPGWMACGALRHSCSITPAFVVELAGRQVYGQSWDNGSECPASLLLQRNSHDVVVYSMPGGP